MSLLSRFKFLRHSLWISYILLGLGVVFTGWLIYRLGVQDIWGYLKTLGWNFFPFLLPSFLSFFFLSWAWLQFLKNNRPTVPFFHLWMVKVVGEAVNNINPLGWGGGDPVRIYLLKKWISIPQGTASVVIDRTLHTMALVVFMIIGMVIAFLKFNFPPSLEFGFILALAFMLIMTLYWYRRQHEGVFEFLIDTLTQLKIKKHWSAQTLQKAKEIDQLISQFYLHHRMGFATAFLFQFMARLLVVVEIFVAAYFLKTPLSWDTAYLLGSVTAIINMVFVLLPSSVGALEGAYAGFFHLLNQDPAIGTSIQILRRLRMVVWSSLGFIYIYHLDRNTRLELKKELSRQAESNR
ncbi:MAG: flippase-like domain-containing protein [Deltaproteobacteria bacterium]|nr:flippase-like domain-containing protein [Deltaproteobacteria bacterium]